MNELRGGALLALVTAFLALFSIVGFALYGLPFFYDFMVRDLGRPSAAGRGRALISLSLLSGARP
ncbi:MAG TPA: hypothetical protein VMT87_12185 [Vicinamibacteria bacterium]|nr:hypothetical protein [Vicinamibacteria bacterium]